MKILLLTALLLMVVIAQSQEYISVKRFFVKKRLEHYLKTNGFTDSRIKETDSTLALRIVEAGMASLNFTYLFDEKNKCVEEKMIAIKCDSCFEKLNAEIIANEKWGWQKLNENLYASKYSKHLLLRISKTDSTGERSIYYGAWNRKEYEALVNNKN